MPNEQVAAQQALWQLMTPEQKKAYRSGTTNSASGGKESSTTAKPAAQFQLIGYLRCELGKSDRDPFLAWEAAQDAAAVYDMLVKLIDGGYILKVGEGKDSPQATLSAFRTGEPWEGWVLSAFASDAHRALTLLLYKHHILCSGDWSIYMNSGGKDFLR